MWLLSQCLLHLKTACLAYNFMSSLISSSQSDTMQTHWRASPSCHLPCHVALCRYGVAWRVACYFPGMSLLALSFLDLLIHHTGTTGAIPLGAFFSLIIFWFLISIPLCFSGEQQA